MQTFDEREAWMDAYQEHVVEAVVENSDDPAGTRQLIQWIRELSPKLGHGW